MDFKDLIGNKPEEFMFMVAMRPVKTIMFISYTSSNDESVCVPCEIVEERYKVADGYKVTMRSIYEGFGQEHFYQSDLMSLIERGSIKAFRRCQTQVEMDSFQKAMVEMNSFQKAMEKASFEDLMKDVRRK